MASLHKLILEAGEHDRCQCPVTVHIPDKGLNGGQYRLKDEKSGKIIFCQMESDHTGVWLSWLVQGLKTGCRQTLLVEKTSLPSPSLVSVNKYQEKGRVDIQVHGGLFTSYNYDSKWVRPFLYPVLGPYGVQVTRNWPMKRSRGEHQDHPHHKSIWVAYGDCDGVDNWSEDPGHGTQQHQKFLRVEAGPVFGRIEALNHWCDAKGKVQFKENREIRIYALSGGIRLFDVTIAFKMTESGVTFRDTKEGGLISIRVASSMDVRNGGRIENGFGGVQEAETWGKPAVWCDYSGQVSGRKVGVAVFDHPCNPRFPTGWHVRDYGLMTANCFAWKHYAPDANIKGDMKFRKGQVVTWRYRLYIHKGNAQQGKVSSRYLDFFAPPKVKVD